MTQQVKAQEPATDLASETPLCLLSGDGVRGRGLFSALAALPKLSMLPFEEHDDVPLPEVLVYDAASRGDGNTPDLTDAAEIFERCRKLPFEQVIVVSSAQVYEPSHHHVGRAAESTLPPLGRGQRRSNGIAACWRELEELARKRLADGAATGSDDETSTKLTLLRSVPVPLAGGRDALSRRLSGRWTTVRAGRDPVIQMVTLDALASAIAALAEARRQGLFHLAPRGAIHLRRALRQMGVRYVSLPPVLMRGSRDALAYFGAPWTLSGDHLQQQLSPLEPPTQGEVLRRLQDAPQASASSSAVESAEAASETASEAMVSDVASQRVAVDRASQEVAPSTEDPYGLDDGYISAFDRTLFTFLHRRYWRLEVRGVEHVPRQGGGVLVGNHRGFMPWDGVMTLHTLRQRIGRTPRYLIHPTLLKFPFLANFMSKLGGVVACRENGEWVLQQGELLGVYPEGIRGAFAPFGKDVYQLRRFGRLEFVKMALRYQVPLVPFVCVGSAEIYPILFKLHWKWFQRKAEWPCLPITPNFGTVPFPTKWHLQFLPPITEVLDHGPDAADDPEVVRTLGTEVRRRMQNAVDDLVARRRSWFSGSLFPPSSSEKPLSSEKEV